MNPKRSNYYFLKFLMTLICMNLQPTFALQTCKADIDCAISKGIYCLDGLCVGHCIPCQEFNRANGSAVCAKTFQDCGPCLPGMLQEALTKVGEQERFNPFCQHPVNSLNSSSGDSGGTGGHLGLLVPLTIVCLAVVTILAAIPIHRYAQNRSTRFTVDDAEANNQDELGAIMVDEENPPPICLPCPPPTYSPCIQHVSPVQAEPIIEMINDAVQDNLYDSDATDPSDWRPGIQQPSTPQYSEDSSTEETFEDENLNHIVEINQLDSIPSSSGSESDEEGGDGSRSPGNERIYEEEVNLLLYIKKKFKRTEKFEN